MQLEAALPIIRALADGINPMTGELYPDHSPYAEPRVLRALYAATDLMQREVERERKRSKTPANFGKPWTEDEDKILAAEFDAGLTIGTIASKHQRTQSSVRLRLEKIGKISPT
jgi:hypothetical protein